MHDLDVIQRYVKSITGQSIINGENYATAFAKIAKAFEKLINSNRLYKIKYGIK